MESHRNNQEDLIVCGFNIGFCVIETNNLTKVKPQIKDHLAKEGLIPKPRINEFWVKVELRSQ